MKAILLSRVSTDQQTLDEQTNNLIEHAKAKGYKQENLIIIEDKESAIKLDESERRGLNEMKSKIANDKSINAVFVWELSRLTRRAQMAYSLRDFFITNKIQLYCKSPEFQLLKDDLSDVDYDKGGVMFGLFVSMAEAETANKKARFHRSKIRNAKSSKFSGGFVKFGYNIDNNGYYEIDVKKAELIREIFNRYEQGISIFKLTKEFLERGKIRTQSLVRNILISEEYTGKYSGEFATDKIKKKDKKLERIYPQIISREQFLRCKEIAKNNNKKADKTNEIYLAHGLIKCVECGSKYIGMKSSVQYLCYGRYGKEARLNRNEACKNSPSININVLDTVLWRACRGVELSYRANNLKNYKNELAKKIDLNNEKIGSNANKIIDEKAEIERTNNLYIKGRLSEEKLEDKYKVSEKLIGDYNNEISKLTSENQLFKDKITELSESISIKEVEKINDDLYSENNLLEKQKIIKRHVNYVSIIDVVSNQTRIIKIYFYIYENPMVYRVHYNKKPQLIEQAFGGIFASEPYQFSKVGFDIVKRFVRKNDKTISLDKPQ